MTRSKSKATLASVDTQQESERDKLIKLVQVWRGKYEKLYSTSQSYEERISKLQSENDQLRRDKEIISAELLEQMENEKMKAEAKISELLTIADTASKKNEVETRDLKTKLRRLEVETQPIIDTYKERDEKLQQIAFEAKQRTIELEQKLKKMKLTLQHQNEDKEQQLAELRRSFEKNAARTRLLQAAKVDAMIEKARTNAIEATEIKLRTEIEREFANLASARVMVDAETAMSPRHRPESSNLSKRTASRVMVDAETVMSPKHRRESSNLTKQTTSAVIESMLTAEKKKWEDEKRLRDEIAGEMRKEITSVRNEIELIQSQNSVEVLELNAKINSLNYEKSRAVDDLTHKLFSLKKKVELGRLKLQQRESTIQQLRETIKDASGTLESRRTQSKESKSSLTVRQLSKQLIVTIREVKSIEKTLKRIDVLRKHDNVFEADDMLRMEILYTTKMSEITRIRRLIHFKLVEDVYHSKRQDTARNNHSRPLSDDEEGDLVFLKSGYGSCSDSEASVASYRESDADQRQEEASIRKKSIRHKKKVIRLPLELTDRTSWLLAPKHYTTINMM